MKYILAHDLGTSGNKATLFSGEGKLITSEVYSYGCHFFNATWAEQDPEDWWTAFCTSNRELTKDIDVKDKQVYELNI